MAVPVNSWCRWQWVGVWLLLLLGSLAAASAFAQTYLPGVSYFGRSNYIEYIAGDLPIIISAPHGGALIPAEMPDRD